MELFFKNNIQQDISIRTVWDASKALFRGLAIRFAAKLKKVRTWKFQDLIDSLNKNEERLKLNPTATELKAKTQFLQHQINVILAEEVAKQIKFTRQSYFENANKPGR